MKNDKQDALSVFTSNPTPHNAIVLAISDHGAFAGRLSDQAFIDALRRAKEQLAERDQLLAIARRFILGCERGEEVGEAFFSLLLDDARRVSINAI